MGEGPAVTIANKAKTYFSDCGYTLDFSNVGTFDNLKIAIKNLHPCGFLLADGIILISTFTKFILARYGCPKQKCWGE